MAGMVELDLEGRPDTVAALTTTQDHLIGCIDSYWNEIDEMIKWLLEKYPEYATQVVVKLTEAPFVIPIIYHKSKYDFDYTRLNPRFTQLFLSWKNKYKRNQKQHTFDHVRKYNHAILYFGEQIAKQRLPIL